MTNTSIGTKFLLGAAAALVLGCGSEDSSESASRAPGADAAGASGIDGGSSVGGRAAENTGTGGGSVAPGAGGSGLGGRAGGSGGALDPSGGSQASGGRPSGAGGASVPGATGGQTAAGGTGSAAVGGGAHTGGSTAAGGATGVGESGGLGGTGSPSTGGRASFGGTDGVGGGATGGRSSSGGSGSEGGATGGRANSGGSDSGDSGGTGGASSGAGGGAVDDVIVTIHNGGFWLDTDGNRIEAHGGGFLQEGDTWYWIGEDKSANSGNFRAVNCYASKDLVTWEFRNAIITRDTASDLSAADRIIERPKVIYNDTTHKYVMWVHWEGQNYAEAEAGVFQSDTIDGDYTYVSSFRPNSNMSRDDTLFKDDDGTAYFISAANENADLMVYELAPDYLDIQRQALMLWEGQKREAPAVFKDNGHYFLITSECTGWDPNQGGYASSTSMTGGWSSIAKLGNSTTYDTQSTYVIPVRGTRATTYIYAGDRWQDPDLASSKYIWLPLRVDGASLSLDYYDTWQLNLTTGEWAVQDEFIPQTNWTLLYVDSEETEGEDGAATNAFDDSSSTYWHTQWEGTDIGHPHEIQIDLGAVYDIEGLRYLPRQDADDHGMVTNYEFYISQDPTNWGTPIKTGTFGTSRSETRVAFTPTAGRYIRFVALGEINDYDWTTIAELDLIGSAQ